MVQQKRRAVDEDVIWTCVEINVAAASSSSRNDLVKNYRVYATHWLISTQIWHAASRACRRHQPEASRYA